MPYLVEDYTALLTAWIKDAQQYLYPIPQNPELVAYGTGYNTWGVQTNQKALSAFAVAALEPTSDFSSFGLTREQVLNQAIAMLRYSLQSHQEGDYHCTDGQKWGHTWISALGIERMMHAVDALLPYLADQDKSLLKKVLLSEANWLLDHHPIVAGLLATEGNNVPENNIWNGALLSRVATMYPDAPRAKDYHKKATRFFVNGISIPSDKESTVTYDGQRVCDVFEGANFYENFALDHHAYLNVGYMVICLSNIAMLHFFYKSCGKPAPKALYHHAKELWKLVRSFTYEDGRLNRIGGDTRVRYCYCQDYALPAWLLAEDLFEDDCSSFEEGWLKILQTETKYNGDGSFLSARCSFMKKASPLYYTRLESDRANVLSMFVLWQRQHGISSGKPMDTLSHWKGAHHGAYFEHGQRRMASFVWGAAEQPSGQCAPVDDSSLLEWRGNLTGSLRGIGGIQNEIVQEHDGRSFKDGFVTWGNTLSLSKGFLAEGQNEDKQANKYTAFAALPDDQTILCLQQATTINRTVFHEIKGLLYNVPNDCINGGLREYTAENGIFRLHGGDRGHCETITAGRWICVEDSVGIVVPPENQLFIHRPGVRQIGITHPEQDTRHYDGTLYADEICSTYFSGFRWYSQEEPIYSSAFGVLIGNPLQTKTAAATTYCLPNLPHQVYSVGITGADGMDYLLIYNLSQEPFTVDNATWINGTTHEKKRDLPPGQAALYRL